MKITMEMLLAAWKMRQEEGTEETKLLREHCAVPGMEIRNLRLFRAADAIEKRLVQHTLFLVREEELSCFLDRTDGKDYAVFILSGDCEETESGNTHTEENCLPGADQNFALFQNAGDLAGLLEKTQEIYIALLSWDREMAEGVYKAEKETSFFSLAREFLSENYAIIDFDMNVVYATELYSRTHPLENGRLNTETFQMLITHKKFHDVASLTSPFYYLIDEQDVLCYCANIFVDRQYIARLVMELPAGMEKLSPGMEELFSVYAAHVQDMFQYGKLVPRKHQNDQLHNLCRQMLQGDAPDPDVEEKTIAKYGWKIADDYLVVVIRFFPEKGWDVQLKTTLPYLAVQLEQQWLGSCAVRSESEIMLILNCGIGLKDASSGGRGTGTAYRILLQQMAYFVRDNVCQAGVSPVFHSFAELEQGACAAREALRIGMVQSPQLWYHLFDEIRLPYFLQQIQSGLPESMLVHPAVCILEKYDKVHGTELSRTLKAFLESGMNMTRAAENLYIHRTTFCRRMDHIRKLTGLELEDPDTVLTLQLSYRIRKNVKEQ